jgi:hypothetical protein
MPSKLKGIWSINSILQITSEYYQNRFSNMIRDIPASAITIKKITVYDNKNLGEARTKFILSSYSWPQYWPYFTKYDNRGRLRTYQRTYKHEYEVTIQLNSLNINDQGIKLRTGADRKWISNISPSLIKSKKNPYGQYLSLGDFNSKMGINGDFFWRISYVRKIEDSLFGRNFAEGFPFKTNPHGINFLTKHELKAVISLLEAGIFKK